MTTAHLVVSLRHWQPMWLPENVKLQLKEGVEKSSKFYSEWINFTYYLNISMLFGWSQDIYYYPLVDLDLWKESLNSGGHQLIQQYQHCQCRKLTTKWMSTAWRPPTRYRRSSHFIRYQQRNKSKGTTSQGWKLTIEAASSHRPFCYEWDKTNAYSNEAFPIWR
jgi:hypothetical protein